MVNKVLYMSYLY